MLMTLLPGKTPIRMKKIIFRDSQLGKSGGSNARSGYLTATSQWCQQVFQSIEFDLVHSGKQH
ncbi:MAG TPA: hypothetical protein VFZ78_09910, partial [Flavisolibacter sp.]